MFSWASIALALLNAWSSFFQWLREDRQRKADEAVVEAKVQKAELDAIQIANKAGDDAVARINAVPGSDGLPDDGFRRD